MFLTLLRAKLLNNETITEILNIFQNAFRIIIYLNKEHKKKIEQETKQFFKIDDNKLLKN